VPQAGKPAGVVVVVVVAVMQGCAPASHSEFDITYFSTTDV